MMKSPNKFAVGDIVMVKELHRDGKPHLAFVEEIVRDNHPTHAVAFPACYSLYGLEPVPMFDDSKIADWYFGDYLEEYLEPTGRKMTKEDLEKYKVKAFPDGGGFSHDMDIVIYNLGRKTGKNYKEI